MTERYYVEVPLPAELVEALEREAEESGRSFNELVEEALEQRRKD